MLRKYQVLNDKSCFQNIYRISITLVQQINTVQNYEFWLSQQRDFNILLNFVFQFATKKGKFRVQDTCLVQKTVTESNFLWVYIHMNEILMHFSPLVRF